MGDPPENDSKEESVMRVRGLICCGVVAIAVSFLMSGASADPQQKGGTSKVIIVNDGFPAVDVEWVRGKDRGPIKNGDTIPADEETTLVMWGRHRQDMYLWGNWALTVGEKSARKEGTAAFKVKPGTGNTVTVNVLPPVAPWSGTTGRYKGTFVLVRTKISEGLLECWRKDGTKGLALDAAQTFVKDRGKKGHFGRFASEKGIIVIVASSGDDVPEPLRKATAAELAPTIDEMLKVIERQRPHKGHKTILGEQSIQEALAI